METESMTKLVGSGSMRTVALVACLLVFPLIVMMFARFNDGTFDLIQISDNINFAGGNCEKVAEPDIGTEPESIQLEEIPDEDLLLGGLLASGFDHESCFSRYQSVKYRKPSPKQPSAYLISKLRKYENLHRRCGPHTEAYKATLTAISSPNISGSLECSYIVWTGQAGLGNRILSMGSTFLYALLTNRVMLVERNADMDNLFCEPFHNTSWLLPEDFPEFRRFDRWDPRTFGNLMKGNIFDSLTPARVNILLSRGLSDFDEMFYCDESHTILQKVPWLILKSDGYYAPGLFLMESFRGELDRMFPDKDSVFHHLGRYLFHPSNEVWGIITRFYQSYLSEAEERIGIQIGVFDPNPNPLQKLTDQILYCALQENLLPEIDMQKLVASPLQNRTRKAVFIASLRSEFYENIANRFWKFPTLTGEIIEVYQLSHEEYRNFEDKVDNVKALVEMYLLSLSDELVTSSGSAFGHVAQGLGDLRPWILQRPENWVDSGSEACRLGVSIEGCMTIQQRYVCKNKINSDSIKSFPYVMHCEDSPSGLKLVNDFAF